MCIRDRDAAESVKNILLRKAVLSMQDIKRTATTGHGSGIIPFSDQHIADILCCARGINTIFPKIKTVIDIEAQSSQIIKIGDNGQVLDFTVSDVCASSSGYFLKVIANVLQIDLSDIGPLSLKSKNPTAFTTGCAVFGESEAISMVAEGIPKEDILAGLHKALAGKIAALAASIKLEEPCAVCGGAALDTGLVKSIEEKGIPAIVPSEPQLVNSLGAAVIVQD